MNDHQRRPAAHLGIALSLGLASALATFGLLRGGYPFFVVASKYDIGMGAPTEKRLALERQTQLAQRYNAMVVFAFGGSLLAGALAGLAESGCRRLDKVLLIQRLNWLLVKILSGLSWGALWGMLTGYVATYAQPIFAPPDALPSLTSSGLSQAFAFGLLGAGLGLIVGLLAENSRSGNVMGDKARTAAASTLAATLGGGSGGFLSAVILGFVAESPNDPQLIPFGALGQLLWLSIPLAAIACSLVIARAPAGEQPFEVAHA